MKMEHLDAGKRQQTDACFCREVPVVQIFPDASASIATHHSFRTIGIVYVHCKISLGDRAFADEHQTIGADALVTITPGNGCFCEVGHFLLHRIDIDVVVARSMHLRETDFAYHYFTFTMVCYPFVTFACKGSIKKSKNKRKLLLSVCGNTNLLTSCKRFACWLCHFACIMMHYWLILLQNVTR